jgi:hypothetical protein
MGARHGRLEEWRRGLPAGGCWGIDTSGDGRWPGVSRWLRASERGSAVPGRILRSVGKDSCAPGSWGDSCDTRARERVTGAEGVTRDSAPNTQHSALSSHRSTFGTRPSAFGTQHSALSIQPPALTARHPAPVTPNSRGTPHPAPGRRSDPALRRQRPIPSRTLQAARDTCPYPTPHAPCLPAASQTPEIAARHCQ